METSQPNLKFNRRTHFEFIDFEKQLSNANIDKTYADMFLRLAQSGNLVRAPGDSRPLSDIFNVVRKDILDSGFVSASNDLPHTLGLLLPYTIHFVNTFREPVLFFLSYVSYDGQPGLGVTSLAPPHTTVSLSTDPNKCTCHQMMKYAVLAADQNGNVLEEIPDQFPNERNQHEINKNGVWLACEDTVELFR